jgi:outer membrane lipoprotein-sorting protein
MKFSRILRNRHIPMFGIFLAILAGAALGAPAMRAQTVDEIIAKNILAHGGLEKLKSIKTLQTSGEFTIGSFRANFLVDNKRPDKVREETIVQGQAQVKAYDGKMGWQVSPFHGRKDPELLSQDDLRTLEIEADIDGPLVDYKAKGHRAELLGHDSVEGTDCYKIKLTLKNGDVRYYYLDADSFLEIKIEAKNTIRGAIEESETYLGDYEQRDGIYFPFAFEIGKKGDSDRPKFTVKNIEINIPLDDSLFSMPVPSARPNSSGGAQ